MSLSAALVMGAVLTGHDPIFIMDKEHCEVLKGHAQMAVDMKPSNSYQNFVRQVMEDYRYSVGKRVIILDNILPYSLAMGDEYFHSPFDPSTPYAQVIYDRCMDRIGTPAK